MQTRRIIKLEFKIKAPFQRCFCRRTAGHCAHNLCRIFMWGDATNRPTFIFTAKLLFTAISICILERFIFCYNSDGIVNKCERKINIRMLEVISRPIVYLGTMLILITGGVLWWNGNAMLFILFSYCSNILLKAIDKIISPFFWGIVKKP